MSAKKPSQGGILSPTGRLIPSADVPSLVQHPPTPKRLPAMFFCTEAGNEPVRRWLKDDLSVDDRIKIGTDIRSVEIGWPLGMPLCEALGRGLWQVRTNLQDRIARVIFFIHKGHMVLLHGFVKKNRETPQGDIDLALERKRLVERVR